MIKKTLSVRKFKAGYELRHVIVDCTEFGCPDFETTHAHTPDGAYIGDSKMAYRLCVTRGLTQLQKAHKDHCICSIGFNEAEQKWHGWSHRCIFGFGIGDKIFIERFGDDNTHFAQHGRTTIKTLAQAKIAAKRFARSVS
jgi:hypothetical protein